MKYNQILKIETYFSVFIHLTFIEGFAMYQALSNYIKYIFLVEFCSSGSFIISIA